MKKRKYKKKGKKANAWKLDDELKKVEVVLHGLKGQYV